MYENDEYYTRVGCSDVGVLHQKDVVVFFLYIGYGVRGKGFLHGGLYLEANM